ncbi:NAD-dependent epimerase/dehydratase family protein [Phycicoccus sp. CSK15P-2]|uniref:NAD-dependent epimerase/dehydratase family protein n=1 Tax=Phycicoccus sp. CSK15P-2 TaxID=2807627 RepID=UPI00194FDF04|nr:NAD-dependent epimerase/dehydratase family protein [Phycicoccus sp. CSK15P-2]MBM6405751.1 NAD-dependent epimerase/dehydratase family protein [Phycicoccus sp. CSK15P-2]
MQTILGASGQIGTELARELTRAYAADVRLVSRSPRTVDGAGEPVSADLLDADQTRAAVAGSEIVYFTAGLPPRTELWETQFSRMLRNALDASKAANAKFAYFDNTYMYPQDGRLQTEGTSFAPLGRKGRVRAEMAEMVLEEMQRGDIAVLIGRAPEFYGPGRTQGFTNALVFNRLKAGRRPFVPVRDDTLRTLIWTPDASRAIAALANAPDAYGQTWHLPVDEHRLTYRQFVTMASAEFGRDERYSIVPTWALTAAGVVSPAAREIRELLPRYAQDNLFDATKFTTRFPDFPVTRYHAGVTMIRGET